MKDKKMVHGGDYLSYYDKYNKMPLDYSENTSPLDMPDGIKEAIIESLELARRYPDPINRRLRNKLTEFISDFYACHVKSENIICGNGAADLIFRICLAKKPKKALLMAPTFAEYEQALSLVGTEIDYYILEEKNNFKIDSNILDKLRDDKEHYDMVFICQPNNPTGILTDREVLVDLLKICKDKDTLLIIDECFMEFVDNYEDYSLFSEIYNYDSLFILKAFTKLYAMAGVRLGYGVSSDIKLIDDIRNAGQPWSVSVMAEYAGMQAIDENEYVKQVREIVFEEKIKIKEFLCNLGIRYIDSAANFILFKLDSEHVENFKEDTLKKGLMIRDCSNYIGLDEGWYRIAVKNKAENQEMMRIFKECYEGEKYDS